MLLVRSKLCHCIEGLFSSDVAVAPDLSISTSSRATIFLLETIPGSDASFPNRPREITFLEAYKLHQVVKLKHRKSRT